MKLKLFLAGVALCFSTTAFAAELNSDVSEDVKNAIVAAAEANGKAKEAGVEWIWAFAQEGIWEQTKELMSSTDVLAQAIDMANEGKNEAAIKAANYIKDVAALGMKQAEIAPKAGPADYGL
ncbi:MAG: hypothetical protein R3F02_17990 [Thiolinea sp.]